MRRKKNKMALGILIPDPSGPATAGAFPPDRINYTQEPGV
jgi:hypothetical protein